MVDPTDEAFAHPSKAVGPVYHEADAQRIAAERGWQIAPDGDGWRRVVACPEPQRIVELETIRLLVDNGVLVISAGGGGIPSRRAGSVRLRGVEAVIDKDLSAALLATELGADALLLLTDVDAVHRAWGTPASEPVREATPAELRALRLPPGSMGSKTEAACRFVDASGGTGAIGALADAPEILRGEVGTLVRPPRDGRT